MSLYSKFALRFKFKTLCWRSDSLAVLLYFAVPKKNHGIISKDQVINYVFVYMIFCIYYVFFRVIMLFILFSSGQKCHLDLSGNRLMAFPSCAKPNPKIEVVFLQNNDLLSLNSSYIKSCYPSVTHIIAFNNVRMKTVLCPTDPEVQVLVSCIVPHVYSCNVVQKTELCCCGYREVIKKYIHYFPLCLLAHRIYFSVYSIWNLLRETPVFGYC